MNSHILKYDDSIVRRLRAVSIAFVTFFAIIPVLAADDPAVPRLAERLLKDKESGIRLAAAVELGRLGPRAKGAVPALIGALNDKEGAVRDAAGAALARIGEPAVEPLLETMKDKDEFTRMRAITVLGEIGPTAKLALTPIKDAQRDDPSEMVRDAARKAFFRVKYEARELAQMLSDPDEEKRRYGVRVLWTLTPQQARPALGELCKVVRNDRSEQVRQDAVYAVAIFRALRDLTAAERNTIIATFAAALKDSDETVCIRACKSLSSFGTLAQAALPAVQQAYRVAKSAELKAELEKTDAYLRGKDPPKK